MSSYQDDVNDWMQRCFGPEISADKQERAFRFLEEALELGQALNVTREEALTLVEYVFGRDIGAPHQEVGGVQVTLAALCNAIDLNMEMCGVAELARCETKIDKIRAKHAAKPVGVRTALPGILPSQAEATENS